MTHSAYWLVCVYLLTACCPALSASSKEEKESLEACARTVLAGFRQIAQNRNERFEGKVPEADALCRGGYRALQFRHTPWVDWSQYWGTGDAASRAPGLITKSGPSTRGIAGALLDLEYQRVELIKFNLFDNSRTYQDYILGRDGVDGPALKRWDTMRLPSDHPLYQEVGGSGAQTCQGDLIRGRTVTGMCNDIVNPAMGSSGQLFARNVEFDTTFPELSQNALVKNRHGDRLGLLKPDPQV